MESVANIFDALGGNVVAAKALGVNYSTATEMKRRGSIPVQYWERLVREAKPLGVDLSYDTLVAVHSPRIEAAE